MNSITDRISLTDDQIEAQFDHLGAGVCVEDLTVTTETIADFLASRESWASKGVLVRNAGGALVIEGAQVLKGQHRHTLYVIDHSTVDGPISLVYKS